MPDQAHPAGSGDRDGDPVIVTLDIDWAPDWIVEDVAERLIRAGVRATFFATHDSPLLRELRTEPLFEFGLHPNLLPASSHGATPDEIFATLRGWYPDATACRTHSLVISEPLLARMASDYGIRVDCSVHLPRAAHVAPHQLHLSEHGDALVRLPHVFQDNMHVLSRRPWSWAGTGLDTPGWKVLNFHPVHLQLNSAGLGVYEAVKRLKPLTSLAREDLPAIDRGAPGAASFFDAVLARLSGGPTFTVSERIAIWSGGEGA